jgi:hypothetical protein
MLFAAAFRPSPRHVARGDAEDRRLPHLGCLQMALRITAARLIARAPSGYDSSCLSNCWRS